MLYPLIEDYKDSFRNPDAYFTRLKPLQTVAATWDKSQPYFISGGFAVVFKLQKANGEALAFKCFTQEIDDRAERLQAIAKHLGTLQSSYFIGIEYLIDELWVCSKHAGDREYPIVVMDWIEGLTLGEYVKQKCTENDQAALHKLLLKFAEMADYLLGSGVAHGDLKHDNIMVKPDGDLVLIDYDGMYVPALWHKAMTEIGSPSYQHPRRKDAPFNPQLDHFSILVILISLYALSLKPTLKQGIQNSDCLLLHQADYQHPAQSRTLQALYALQNPALSQMLTELMRSLENQTPYIPVLKAVIGNVKGLPKPAPKTEEKTPPPGAGGLSNMILIPGGTFLMGSPSTEAERLGDETQHTVTVSAFRMGKYQVTQAEWQAVMGKNPSRFQGCDNCPVEQVSWDDVQEFIQKLNTMFPPSGGSGLYRLPTEEEWEYACRAGTTTPFSTGNNLTTNQANYDPYNDNAKGTYRAKTTSVGSFAPNAWGLYDMHGNVWEWTSSLYENSSARVRRGGSWLNDAKDCRSANRFIGSPEYRLNNLGFRLVSF